MKQKNKNQNIMSKWEMDNPSLKPYFWDVEYTDKLFMTNPEFVIERITEEAPLPANLYLIKRYGLDFVRKVVYKSRRCSDKTKNFWRVCFND